MDWGETIRTHEGARFAQDVPVVWREPVLELNADGVCERFAPYAKCSYCGSISPKQLYELDQRLNFGPTFIYPKDPDAPAQINPGPHVELADMKYGYPHKLYVETREILHPEVEFVVSRRYGRDGKSEITETRKGSPAYIKFYTEHLLDLDAEALELLKPLFARALNRELGRDATGLYIRRLLKENP